MTSEEMKNEVLSRAAALDRAKSRRIKTAAASAACAAAICAAAVPIYNANRPGAVKPQAQITVQNAGLATAGNTEKTTVRVTISAPAEQTGQSAVSSSASTGSSSSGISETTAFSQQDADSGVRTTTKSEPETNNPLTTVSESTPATNKPTAKSGEPTTKINEQTTTADESTIKADETQTKANISTDDINETTDVQNSEDVTTRYAPVTDNTPQPSDDEADERNNGIIIAKPDSADKECTAKTQIDENSDYQSMTDIINDDWNYYIKLLDLNGSFTPFKLPRGGKPVSGRIIINEKTYSFYAESYAPIETDGEYLGTVSDYETSASYLNSYDVRRFSGIKDENRDMILISDSERYFIFAETD